MKQFLFLLAVVGVCLLAALFEPIAPSADGIEIHTHIDEERTLKPALEDALDDVLSFFERKHNIIFNGPLHIIFSQDSAFVAEKYYALSRPHVSQKNAHHFARVHCDADDTISGVITLKTMLMCISPVEDVDQQWLYHFGPQISATLTHEIMHALQHDMSNDYIGGIKSRVKSGPIWIAEGSANYMARDFHGATDNKIGEFNRVFKRAQGTKITLGELQHSPPLARFNQYAISHLAAHLLIERYGAPAMFQYWENIGEGHSWESSFARAFSMQMSEFEKQFETLRRDPNAAMAWISG
jgi:hypothetical protein